MRSLKHHSFTRDCLLLVIGTGLVAFAVQSVFAPAQLVTGGFSGIAIIVQYLTIDMVKGGIPLGLTNFVLNVPLFLIAIYQSGIKKIWRSVLGTCALSVWLSILPVFSFAFNDMILVALSGGVLTGVGVGLIFVAKGTTGGSDLMASVLQKYFRNYSLAQLMFVIDGAIVLAGAFLFGVDAALYAMISVFIVTKLTDGIVDGMKYARLAFIITKKKQEVTEQISKELQRGITLLEAKGHFSGVDQPVLFCVVGRKQIVDLKEIVMDTDPEAFVVVSDAREVLGEGFQRIE